MFRSNTATDSKAYTLDIQLETEAVNDLLGQRVLAGPTQPSLVTPADVAVPTAYKRFNDSPGKVRFRRALSGRLHQEWTKLYGEEKAKNIGEKYSKLATDLDNNGAVIFGSLIETSRFQLLIKQYGDILQNAGSKSWIHSYVNLGNQPEFLCNQQFNSSFLHPLLTSLIAERVGGPIRIVDARGKDAEPISVLAQDNMLHIDNTPFNDEYKIILTWERGKASGPRGQNFVYIPGTQRAVRNCFISSEGKAWSTENASIFITPNSIEQLFHFQKTVRQEQQAAVVEVHHRDKPLTTVFAAGSLVHHRYRTEEGSARSCMILAFHRAKDNPGQFVAPAHLARITNLTPLNSMLFGYHGVDTEEKFLAALSLHADDIAVKIEELDAKISAEIIEQKQKQLSKHALEKWKTTATGAPTVEELKIKQNFFPLSKELTADEFILLLNQMMRFDKHGPLDLILYHDSHEEIRKWARNRIREMKVDRLAARLNDWKDSVKQPDAIHLLNPIQLKSIADYLVRRMNQVPSSEKASAKIDAVEKISPLDAHRSVSQLINDLGEAILRCDSRQTFLSTSLFLFWAYDELCRLQGGQTPELKSIGELLLNNYIATACLIEKQIQRENYTRTFGLFAGNNGLMKSMEDTFVDEHRHDDPAILAEYNRRFGIVVR